MSIENNYLHIAFNHHLATKPQRKYYNNVIVKNTYDILANPYNTLSHKRLVYGGLSYGMPLYLPCYVAQNGLNLYQLKILIRERLRRNYNIYLKPYYKNKLVRYEVGEN